MSNTPVGSNMPEAEISIDENLVRRLLEDQHPDLAGLAISESSHGWDNVMFRLGTELAVRIPRRAQAAELIEHEQLWLPIIGPDLPLPVPTPVRVGTATEYYPWAWSVLPWFAGAAVGLSVPSGKPATKMAEVLGGFLAALHVPAPDDAPVNAGRGCPLADRDAVTRQRIEALFAAESPAEAQRTLDRWQRFVAVSDWAGPPLWVHGDLHAFNLVMDAEGLRAVVDFGDITSGDPAVDLAIAFSLFEPEDRAVFRNAANSDTRPIDDAMWARAEGWAFSVGIAILASSADNPKMRKLGQRMTNPVA